MDMWYLMLQRHKQIKPLLQKKLAQDKTMNNLKGKSIIINE